MLQSISPADGGLLYTETNLNHFFPEPWNMVSSALFLIPGIYWLIKLKVFDRRYAFLSIATYLLLIGCVGSTTYHGLRRWPVFIYMDWVPIAILCLASSVYFWIKLSGKAWAGVLALIMFLMLTFELRRLLPRYDVQLMVSLNYIVMVLMIVLPLILLLWKLSWHGGWLVSGAFVAFGFAIGFRAFDKFTTLSMGTHFLWHTFGAIATSLMFVFIYKLDSANSINRAKHA